MDSPASISHSPNRNVARGSSGCSEEHDQLLQAKAPFEFREMKVGGLTSKAPLAMEKAKSVDELTGKVEVTFELRTKTPDVNRDSRRGLHI